MKYFFPNIAKRRSIPVAKIKKTYSIRKPLKFKTLKKEVIPETKKMSKRLEPSMFPRLNWRFPFLMEVREVTNSGIEVPRAIRVKPIKKLLTLNFFAKAVDWSMKISEDLLKLLGRLLLLQYLTYNFE